MKRNIKILTITFIIAAFILSAVNLAFCAEINSNPVNVGDTVSYEIRVNPCPNMIQALDVVIYYDSNSLEYVPYSLELPNISGFMTNTDLNGEIRFNAMDFVGFDFSEDKILSTVKFTVKDTTSQDLSLNYNIKTFIDSTSTDLGSTYTYDVTSVEGGIERDNQSNTDSELIINTDTVSSKISDDSDDVLNRSDTEILDTDEFTDIDSSVDSNIDFNTDTSTDTDTTSDTDTNTDSEIIDHFDEFLTEINSESSSVNESAVSSQPESHNSQSNAKHYIIALAAAIAVILLIGIIFKIIAKRSNNGSHFS